MIRLTYDHENYRYRLNKLAMGIVYKGVTVDEVKREIEYRREIEGDAVAEDLARICRELWKGNAQ